MEQPLVRHLIPEYLEEIEKAEERVSELEARKAAFEAGEEYENGDWEPDDPEKPNFAKDLETHKKGLKQLKREDLKRAGKYQKEIDQIDLTLSHYKKIKKRLTKAKRAPKQLESILVTRLEIGRDGLDASELETMVLSIFLEAISEVLVGYVDAHLAQMVDFFETIYRKYSTFINRDNKG